MGSMRLAAIALAGFALACATRVDVTFDEGRDFSPYRTWNWLPGAASQVDAPLGDGLALEARLVRLVEGALEARGFERSAQQADLLVSVYLGIQRELVLASETGAVESVQSLHSTPSYEIQVTRQELHSYERGYILVAVSDAVQRRPIWRGEFQGRFRGNFWPHLDEAVSILLQQFPPE